MSAVHYSFPLSFPTVSKKVRKTKEEGSLIAHSSLGEENTHLANSSALFILASACMPLHPLGERYQSDNQRERLTCAEQLWVSPCLNISAVMKRLCFSQSALMGPNRCGRAVFFSSTCPDPWGKHREVMWKGRDVDTLHRYHYGSQTTMRWRLVLGRRWGTRGCSIEDGRTTA